MINSEIVLSEDAKQVKTVLNDSVDQRINFEKIQDGKYAETFLKFLAEKYQESFDGNMKGFLANDHYLSNDEIELIIESHLDKNDNNLLEKSLHQMAQNKFDSLEKLASFPNFVKDVPMLTEALNKFMEDINFQKKGQHSTESVVDQTNIQVKQSNLNLEHLTTFFEYSPITKKSLDGLIQTHSKYPQRLITAIEEQIFPSTSLQHEDKKAIGDSVKEYIKTMSNVVQSGAILQDKTKNTPTYLDKVNVLENTHEKVIQSDAAKDLAAKLAKKGKGITVYQDHNIMYSLLKNFGKNFSQSFQKAQFESDKKQQHPSNEEYELRKTAVNTFVQKLEKVIGKQHGIESLKAQKHEIVQGRFSEIIQINGIEARFYLVKKEDKYLVSVVPKPSEMKGKKATVDQKNKPEINVQQKKYEAAKSFKTKH
jgi:hypothetical protein